MVSSLADVFNRPGFCSFSMSTLATSCICFFSWCFLLVKSSHVLHVLQVLGTCSEVAESIRPLTTLFSVCVFHSLCFNKITSEGLIAVIV